MPREEPSAGVTHEMALTFDQSAAEVIVQTFGWEVDSAGYIHDAETGDVVVATDGAPIMIENLAGVVPDENGDPTPLNSDFNSLVDHVKRRQEDAE